MAKEITSVIRAIRTFLFGRMPSAEHRKAMPMMFSSVGGGPLERVTQALSCMGTPAEMHAMWSPETWRKRFKGGKTMRILTRLEALALYPAKAVWDGFVASAITNVGDPLTAPVLVVTTNPFLLPCVAALTKPLHRCAVVALMYDMYPDALEAAGMTPNILTRCLEHINQWTIRHVDGVVYLGDVMRASAEQRYGTHPNTWIIDNGADPDEFGKTTDALPQDLRDWMDGRTLFSYVGNMGVMHDVVTLEKGIPAFLDSLSDQARSRVGFIFAASGAGVKRLQDAWGNRYADCIRFIGPQPDREWAELLYRSDIALATLADRAWATCAPSKVYSAIAAGCVLLAVTPEHSDLAAIVRGNQDLPPAGLMVTPGDIQGLVDKLTALCNETAPLLSGAWSEQIAVLADYYDVSNMAERWQACLERALDNAPQTWASCTYRITKRALDITASSLGLLLLSPVLALTAAGVRHNLGTPVTFRQKRPGLDAVPFELIKFRSMTHTDAPIDVKHDADRLTPFGQKIRALSLDELPTLLNVLKGEMSLVGPRPLLMAYLDRYNDEQKRRHWVIPGITGWAQVNGRNSLSWDEKFKFDTWYVEHASLWLDLKILFKTLAVVFRRTGIRHAQSATMPEFEG